MLAPVDQPCAQSMLGAVGIAIAVLIFALTRPTLQRLEDPSMPTQPPITTQPPRPAPQLNSKAALTHPLMTGIDVSHYQGEIHWQAVKNSGIQFAYVKATEGVHFQDPMYRRNTQQLRNLHIPFGSYHFFDPLADPIAQAKHYLNTLATSASLPPALDVEVAKGVAPTQLSANITAWLQYVHTKLGCRPILYSNHAFATQYLATGFTEYPFWYANYSSHPVLPQGITQWVLWQKQSDARINGIKPLVDLNIFRGNQKDFHAFQCPVK